MGRRTAIAGGPVIPVNPPRTKFAPEATMKTLLLILIGISAPLIFTGCRDASAPTAAAPLYRCPMHPTYTSHRPGECPICHMSLVAAEREPAPASAAEKKPLFYRNPMNPDVTSPVPAKDEMGMDYVPVFAVESSSGAAVPGRGPVAVAADKEQWIGVRTAPVERRDLEVLVRASARVSYDPDLYAALAEHREALAARDRSGDPEGRARAESLVRASRLRLAQLGLTDQQMDAMSKQGGGGLLAGSGPRWVYAQIFEDEAALIKPGQRAELTSPAFPGRVLNGRVEAVDRVVDPATRTLRARVLVSDGESLLRPEMFLEAVVHVGLGRRLVAPKEALIDTGLRRLVYVRTAPGHYAPREITTGREGENDVEVLTGLEVGETVAASGNFLLDSESRLKSVVSDGKAR